MVYSINIILFIVLYGLLSNLCIPFLLCLLYCYPLSCSVMETKLKEREEREQQLTEAKVKLENDIAEIMKSSGDSSAQLMKMNDELRLKERYSIISKCFHIISLFLHSLLLIFSLQIAEHDSHIGCHIDMTGEFSLSDLIHQNSLTVI